MESVKRDLEKKVNMKAKPRKEDLAALRVAQDKAVGCRRLCDSKKEEANFKKKCVCVSNRSGKVRVTLTSTGELTRASFHND